MKVILSVEVIDEHGTLLFVSSTTAEKWRHGLVPEFAYQAAKLNREVVDFIKENEHEKV